MTYDELDLPMPSTMRDEPLSPPALLRCASTVHADATLRAWTGTEFRVLIHRELRAAAGPRPGCAGRRPPGPRRRDR
ncbi:hypothetical protein ACWDUL_02475 [Nocardia niigatensis]|uniref:hypothetical protein n=1 Tax=Nocardia niigatensis TaxID=209249 RepID=UPI0002EF9700|nr:hypothetical protein [Nocardia niigatensis]